MWEGLDPGEAFLYSDVPNEESDTFIDCSSFIIWDCICCISFSVLSLTDIANHIVTTETTALISIPNDSIMFRITKLFLFLY